MTDRFEVEGVEEYNPAHNKNAKIPGWVFYLGAGGFLIAASLVVCGAIAFAYLVTQLVRWAFGLLG